MARVARRHQVIGRRRLVPQLVERFGYDSSLGSLARGSPNYDENISNMGSAMAQLGRFRDERIFRCYHNHGRKYVQLMFKVGPTDAYQGLLRMIRSPGSSTPNNLCGTLCIRQILSTSRSLVYVWVTKSSPKPLEVRWRRPERSSWEYMI